MSRIRRSISVYVRILRKLFPLPFPSATEFGFQVFLGIDCCVLALSLKQSVASWAKRGQPLVSKAVNIGPQIPRVVSSLINDDRLDPSLPLILHFTPFSFPRSAIEEHGFVTNRCLSLGFLPEIHSLSFESVTSFSAIDSKLAEASPIPRPKSMTVVVGFSMPEPVSTENVFGEIPVERLEYGYTGAHTIRLLPQMSISISCLEDAVFNPGTVRCQRGTTGFISPTCSPFPLRLSPSKRSGYPAEVHNGLLSRINNGLRFIGEVDSGIQEFERLSEELFSLVKTHGPTAATSKIWAEYPGAAACYVALAGAYKYTHGEYWDFAFRAIGIPSTPSYQRTWGQHFLWFILGFGLNPSREVGLRYVGPILFHAMLPNDCLPEVFGQILEPAVRSPSWTGLSARELIPAWIGQAARFVGIDKPVWQFLKYGGRVAEEFVSEVIRMVRCRYETGIIPPASDFMLPQRIVQCYGIWLYQQNDPPPARNPFLQLDPYSGIKLAFPDQKMAVSRVGHICSWEVFVSGRRLRGPTDYAQRRNDEAVFSAPDMPVSPHGPYEIQLVVDSENIGSWNLNGMSSERNWKAFSGRNCKELDVSRLLHAEPTWIVVPENDTVIAKDFRRVALTNVETQLCHLTGEWMGYKAIEINLSEAVFIEICCGESSDVLEVDHPEGEIILSGGDLLQNAETSADDVSLFGNAPPQLVLLTKPGEDTSSLERIRMRIAGDGIGGSCTSELTGADVAPASHNATGQVVIDLRQVIPAELCPGELTIVVWYQQKRLADCRFRWVPDLTWEWKKDARSVEVFLPDGATLSEKREDGLLEPCKSVSGSQLVPIPEARHDVELVLSWHRPGLQPFSVPLKFDGPRWAFLRFPADTPIWQARPIEMLSDSLLEEDSPCILLEMRDRALLDAKLLAQWIGFDQDKVIVDMGVEQLSRNNRWLIRLSGITDTLRTFQHADSQIIVEGTTSASPEAKYVQICVMQIPAATIFRWAFLHTEDSDLEWSEVCIDVDTGDLLQWDSVDLLFEASGKRWIDSEVRVFWRSFGESKSSHPLSVDTCADRGKWLIKLGPIVKYVEGCSTLDSEVCLEAEATGMDDATKVDTVLLRIHRHPAKLLTYEDCRNWAEGNNLRTLALDLLCDLHYKYWFSVDLLSSDWKKPQELIRRALRTVRFECPDISVTERQNTFAMSRETYRRMFPVLIEWDRHRRWI